MLVSDFSNLEKALGYKFNDKTLLLNALTHTSFANERYHKDSHLKSNERVEFVGDAVLGLVAGTHIYQNYPYMPEGKMSKLRAGVVCEASLAKLALQIGLDDYLRLGVGEEQSGGRTKPSLLADAFESVLGAIYLDGGFEAARKVLIPLIVPEIIEKADNVSMSDYKSRLQELLGKKHLQARYEIVDAAGPDHQRVFTARVVVDENLSACGTGKSKKEAEQAAAKNVLDLL
jgi:ribonuclease-3